MSLKSISPIDGRYNNKVKELSDYFSEYALIKKRIYVELEYLKELGKGNHLKILDDFNEKETEKIKDIEKKTNHDIKAVEYYLREKLPDVKEFVHYGLTSEDINNLAYGLLIKDFLNNVFFKQLSDLLEKLQDLSLKYKSMTVLAHTHGQPASPTTVGKEFLVFFSRLENQFQILKKIELTGKLNGASGNYNALALAYPEKNWLDFSRDFILRLGLKPNLITTQVEPKDTLIELFQNVKRINNIVLDLDRDMWLYISMDYFSLKKKEDEVGSSTMPHKVNPIDFENSEGNIKIANSLLTGFEELQISRLQRDLSDSTMMRNIGVMFAHSILAYKSTLNGLNKIIPNEERIESDLEKHPEVLTEAVQVIMRKHNQPGYDILKKLTRGKKITVDDIHKIIEDLNIPVKEKKKLKRLQVKDYKGYNKLTS